MTIKGKIIYSNNKKYLENNTCFNYVLVIYDECDDIELEIYKLQRNCSKKEYKICKLPEKFRFIDDNSKMMVIYDNGEVEIIHFNNNGNGNGNNGNGNNGNGNNGNGNSGNNNNGNNNNGNNGNGNGNNNNNNNNGNGGGFFPYYVPVPGRDGLNGAPGAPGVQGNVGPQGNTGPQGNVGPAGVTRFVIPYASGGILDVDLFTSNSIFFVGFGSYNAINLNLIGIPFTIDNTNGNAFDIPINSTIISISAHFTISLGVTISAQTTTISAVIYVADADSNSYTLVDSVEVGQFPIVTTTPYTHSVTHTLPTPANVTAGQKIILAFYLNNSSPLTVSIGYFNVGAGILFEQSNP